MVTGALSSDRPVFAAVYNSAGRMLSVKRLLQDGFVKVAGGDIVKLFWLSAETGMPLSDGGILRLSPTASP